jgi:2-isopropylmalate synthase
VQSVSIGFPGSSPASFQSSLSIASHIAFKRLQIKANAAARTLDCDLMPIAELQQMSGMRIEAAAFIGCSPVRMEVEGWTQKDIIAFVSNACDFARHNDLDLMLVTEDTTRSAPDMLKAAYGEAIQCGVKRICIADTCGHITPSGVRNLLSFIRTEVAPRPIQVDWHGHNDRGLGLTNALAAISAGADRLHATVLGIGERSGNTNLETLLVNLAVAGAWTKDLKPLHSLVELFREALDWPIPPNTPVFGRDAFRTATGVHAAAIGKAIKAGRDDLADAIYSGVPAAAFGKHQELSIGSQSGKANALWVLAAHGIEPTQERVNRLLSTAKTSNRVLTSEEIFLSLFPETR